MRHNALFRRFISALTRGGPGGMPRPIEVHAHDPLRYVGDMLGWLHQALASERELVLALLDPDAVVDTGPTARRFSSKGLESDIGKNETDLTFVLDRIFEGLEEGQVKMQSRLEEEEEAKAALMSRIQRLIKLILVSTKNAIPAFMLNVAGGLMLEHPLILPFVDTVVGAIDFVMGLPKSLTEKLIQAL
ncbi:hypothetical protein TEA_000052 [Camellia sinensis var. sinensis]|uniref:Conserved Oligomeric Golgi complex subunit 6 C-terminal domain-containing protein n=1 Tax=Camellia sinensis var. sinensis TaxID=542762 RepID=A0A4S4D2T8_CAMSN|nr:hypothetical protein TEA_000052 [Camellia sinensis var. sinensis]